MRIKTHSLPKHLDFMGSNYRSGYIAGFKDAQEKIIRDLRYLVKAIQAGYPLISITSAGKGEQE